MNFFIINKLQLTGAECRNLVSVKLINLKNNTGVIIMEFIQIKRIMDNQIGLPLHKTMVCRGNPLALKCENFPFNDPSTTTTEEQQVQLLFS